MIEEKKNEPLNNLDIRLLVEKPVLNADEISKLELEVSFLERENQEFGPTERRNKQIACLNRKISQQRVRVA